MGPLGPIGCHEASLAPNLPGGTISIDLLSPPGKKGGPTWIQKKIEIEGVGTPGDLRTEILRRTPVPMPQMVAWQPIWLQNL